MLASILAVKQQEEAVQQCSLSPCSLAAQSLPLGTTARLCPAAGDGEEQQGTAIPLLGHEEKTVTQEEEGDAESAYAAFPKVDVAFHRLLARPSGFVCLSECNRSRAGPEHCLRMMAHACSC